MPPIRWRDNRGLHPSRVQPVAGSDSSNNIFTKKAPSGDGASSITTPEGRSDSVRPNYRVVPMVK